MRRLLPADLTQVKVHLLAIIVALVCFGLSCFIIWDSYAVEDHYRLLAVASLGISVAIASRFSTRDPRVYPALAVTGGLFLALFYFTHRESPYFGARLLQLGIATHLWIAISPAIQTGFSDDKLTGRLNWFLFTRIFIVSVQSGLLLAGLMLALGSLDFLFGIKIIGKWYSTLGALVFYVVTCFLLVGALGEKERETNPAILRLLIQNVFVPLSVLYFAILYMYGGLILLNRSWPNGKVGWLVSGLSAMITFSFLVKRPFESEARFPGWIQKFSQWSFALLLPLLFLLCGAIWRRVSEYGWTEERVALALLTAWMIGICIAYIRPQRRTLHAIPVSLLAVVLIFLVGPLSLQSIALKSQTRRLRELLGVPAGQVNAIPNPDSVNRTRVYSVLEHLCQKHGASGISSALGFESNWSQGFHTSEWMKCHPGTDGSLTLQAARRIGLGRDSSPDKRSRDDQTLVDIVVPGGPNEMIEVNGSFAVTVTETPIYEFPSGTPKGFAFSIADGPRPKLRWRFRQDASGEIDLLEIAEKMKTGEEKLGSRTATQTTEQGDFKLVIYRMRMTKAAHGAHYARELKFHAMFTPRASK